MEVPYGQLGSVRFDVVRFIDNIPWAIIPVGRTKTARLEDRLNYHKRTKGLFLVRVITGLTYEEARGIEEIAMIQCHTITKDPQIPGNRIHGVSETNPLGALYMFDALGFIENKLTNLYLNLLDGGL